MRKETSVERIVLVLNTNGTVRAAHQERLERYLDDADEVIVERYLSAEPVAASHLADLIGEQQAQWALEAVRLAGRVAELEQRLALEQERNATSANQPPAQDQGALPPQA